MQGISMLIVQEMYIEKTCSVNFNYSMDICGNLIKGNHSEIQGEVQKHVAILQGVNGFLQAVPGVVIALFAGSWSDIFGRKPLIVASCFGYIINNLVYILNAYFWFELKAEYLLFEVKKGREEIHNLSITTNIILAVPARLHRGQCGLYPGLPMLHFGCNHKEDAD